LTGNWRVVDLKADEKTETFFDNATMIGNYLSIYFDKEQGVRLGESTVVSLKAHAQVPGRRGQVRILLNRDAGKTYRGFVDTGQVVHIDVHHGPGAFDVVYLARKMLKAIEDRVIRLEPSLQFNENERMKNMLEYAGKTELYTRYGNGSLYELCQGEVEPPRENDRKRGHIHILAVLTRDKYDIILPLVEAVEDGLTEQGIELGKVKRIFHAKERVREESLAGYLVLPWRKKSDEYSTVLLRENQNQLLVKLAQKFASVDELQEFLEGCSTNLFKRKSRREQRQKVGDLDDFLQQLEDLDILRKSLIGPVLTKAGKELLTYLEEHKCDIEAEIRREIRKSPLRKSRYQRIGKGEITAASVQYTNRNKTVPLEKASRNGGLAVPDTIVQAKKSCLLRGEKRLTIRKEDMQVYDQRSRVPIDVCLLIDASASMAGEKRQAACYLAEHLLLTGREKVAVVIFQQTKAKVVVPFTRNHKLLTRGLQSIAPEGLTPLADGIATSLKLIRSSRVSNPLLVLITDGMPNFPLWTTDAREDALTAAEKIASSKLRFICIGLESNKVFLQELVSRSRGTLYVVDDLNRNTLIDIVRYEKRLTAVAGKS